MMRSRRNLSLALSLWIGPLCAGASDPDPAQLELLRGRIRQLQQELKAEIGQRDNMRTNLEQGEQVIAELHEDLRQTKKKLTGGARRLQALRNEVLAQKNNLVRQREQLTRLVRAKYMAGRIEPLKLLLTQRDPAKTGRAFTYYEYLARARSERLEGISTSLSQLVYSQSKLEKAQAELQQLSEKQARQYSRLETQRTQRRELLARLNSHITNTDVQVRRLQADADHLARLLQELNRRLADLPSRGTGFSVLRGRLALPVTAPIQARFGEARRVAGTYWRGLMFRAPAGTPVRAIYHGQVVYADWLRGFGLLLIVDHGQGYMSLYSHNQQLLKGVGARVAEGEEIALVGDSGGLAETGLYFELRHNGTPQDPLLWCNAGNGGR